MAVRVLSNTVPEGSQKSPVLHYVRVSSTRHPAKRPYQIFLRKDASEGELVIAGRVSVVLVAAVAIGLAYDRDSTILSLVSNAWAGFGAAFGPLVLFSLFSRNMTRAAAFAGMITGAATVLLWIYLPVQIEGQSLSQWMYEIVPGFVLSSIAIVVVSKFTQPRESVQVTFAKFEEALHQQR